MCLFIVEKEPQNGLLLLESSNKANTCGNDAPKAEFPCQLNLLRVGLQCHASFGLHDPTLQVQAIQQEEKQESGEYCMGNA